MAKFITPIGAGKRPQLVGLAATGPGDPSVCDRPIQPERMSSASIKQKKYLLVATEFYLHLLKLIITTSQPF